ncbi:MAG: hypothetical protein WD885_02775 [Candidatus Saccharimonadales bacterium]
MNRFRNFISWALLILVIGFGVFALTNFQAITDYFRLRNYDPSMRIEELADKTTMLDDTRRIFYVNHPKLSDKVEFNEECRTTEQSIILGCFVANKGIFLLDVQEPKLNGVIEVTAAHEVLHAHYERLGASEREKVDRMTADFFKNNVENQRIIKTIENYREKDPSVVPNELHSILATEVKDLSPELEEYYKKYFSDRTKIVKFSEQYEQAFIDLEQQASYIESQLASLKTRIDINKGQIDALSVELNSEKARLDDLLRRNEAEEYNSSVDGFNRRVSSYNSLINQTRQLINQYNDLVAKQHSLVLQQQELNEAIDSNILKEKL